MRKKPPHGKVQRWSATFHALDRNGDGKIDRTELVRLLGTEMASTLLQEIRDVADHAGDYVSPSFEQLEHRRNISTPTRPDDDPSASLPQVNNGFATWGRMPKQLGGFFTKYDTPDPRAQ